MLRVERRCAHERLSRRHDKACANADFVEWITAPYPRGLGTTEEVVEAILTSAKDRGKAEQARLLWDRAVRRGDGGNNNPHGRAGKPDDAGITVYNIHGDKRPAGTTAAAGLRRLDHRSENGERRANRRKGPPEAARQFPRAGCGFTLPSAGGSFLGLAREQINEARGLGRAGARQPGGLGECEGLSHLHLDIIGHVERGGADESAHVP